MYQKDFNNIIEKKDIPKSLLLYGDDEYILTKYTNKIINILQGSQGSNSSLKLYFDEYDFNIAKKHLSQSSLFGDKNILFIKSDKIIPRPQIKKLIDICFKNSQSFMIFQYQGDSTKAKSFIGSFSKNKFSNYVRFFMLDIFSYINILMRECDKLDIKTNQLAMRKLYELHNGNISLCISDIKRVALVQNSIFNKDIYDIFYGSGGVNMDLFVENIIKGNDFRKELEIFMESSSYNEVLLINYIQNYLNQLFLFRSFIKTYGRFDSKEILGYRLPIDIARKKANIAMNIKTKQYKSLFLSLLNSEYNLKKTAFGVEKKIVLLSSLINFQKLL